MLVAAKGEFMRKFGFFSVILACLALALVLAACNNGSDNGDEIIPANYTVTFNANGGSGTAPKPITVHAGSRTALPGRGGLSKNGYIFGGWNTNEDGAGTNYQSGDYFTPTAHTTLYAKWNAVYTVTFLRNGGSGTPPTAQTVNAGSSISLPDGTELSKSGYTFGGWNTNVSGTGYTLQPGDSYTPTGDITMYAKWDTTYTVIFNSNGGSGTVPNQITANAGSGITLPNEGGLTRTGYIFGGWSNNVAGTGTIYQPGNSYTSAVTIITLYAIWTSTVTYNINGGTGTIPDAQTVNADSSITLPSGSGLSRTGYTFSGWNTNVSGTGTNYSAGSSYMPTGDITLYAKWDVIYTVTYDINEGTGTTPTAQTVTAEDSVTLPTESGFSRTGYTFGGWNINTSGTGTNYNAGFLYTPSGNITLYAKWDRITYNVTYNINSGNGTIPATQTVNAGDSLTLPTGNGFSRTGYTFGGWNTHSDGTGINNSAGSSYTPSGSITLYVKWNEDIKVSGTTLAAKLDWLAANAASNTGYILEVSANESLGPRILSYSGKSDIVITLTGIGATRTISLSSNDGSLFSVASGVTLVLDSNITLQGRASASYTNTSSLVLVDLNGSLIMNTGATITGNRTSASYGGGGVSVHESGTFTMHGGTISGNTTTAYAYTAYGGGVCVYGGTFTMNGGEITGNTATAATSSSSSSSSRAYGGGVYVSSGTFTMNDGTISNNTATASASSSTAYAYGGGVYVSGGTFTMHGGTVLDNTARASSTTTNVSLYAYGGGVCVSGGTFTMNSGTVSDNTATVSGGGSSSSSYGGGVGLSGGTFTMYGGTVSGNNTTGNSYGSGSYGGGVGVSSGTFRMSGGEITGNTASGYGGGVYVSGTFTKTNGGTITGYTSSPLYGNVVKTGSTIQSSNGHAVYVDSSKRRETTAGPSVNMNSATSGAAGGWN